MSNVSDIATRVAANTGFTQKDAESFTKEVFKAISGELTHGEEVSIAGFGKFSVKDTAERQGRNPATGQAVTIPASKKVSFKAAKQLKDAL